MVGLAVTPTTPSSSSSCLNCPETSCVRSILSYHTLCPNFLSSSNGFVIVYLLLFFRKVSSLHPEYSATTTTTLLRWLSSHLLLYCTSKGNAWLPQQYRLVGHASVTLPSLHVVATHKVY